MEKDNIEKSLETAHTIHFFPTDNYDIEPSVIAVEINNFGLGGVAYNKLLDAFHNKKIALTILDNKNTLDIALTDKARADNFAFIQLSKNRTLLLPLTNELLDTIKY